MRPARLVLAVVPAVLLGCADRTTGVTADVPPALVINGELAGERFGNVGAMVARVGPAAPWVPACTGTLIAPTVVVTAGHCIAFGRAWDGFTEFGVSFDPVVTGESRIVTAQPRLHPDFWYRFPFPTPDDPAEFFDVAVLLLDEPVGLTPATLPPVGLLGRLAETSAPATIVGYGLPRADASWSERGTRRVGGARLGRAVGPVAVAIPHDAIVGFGDSGGALFLGPAQADRGARGATMLLAVTQGGDGATFSTFYRLDTPAAQRFLGQYVDLVGAHDR
jgi:hypothetical protein